MTDDDLLTEAHGALREFGMHKYLCASRTQSEKDRSRSNPCNCGLGEITRKLAQRIKSDAGPSSAEGDNPEKT